MEKGTHLATENPFSKNENSQKPNPKQKQKPSQDHKSLKESKGKKRTV